MQADSSLVLVDGTPASTKGMASAVAQVVQALAVVAQGVTAAVKLWRAVTLQVTAGGGGGDDASGGGMIGGGGGEACVVVCELHVVSSVAVAVMCRL